MSSWNGLSIWQCRHLGLDSADLWGAFAMKLAELFPTKKEALSAEKLSEKRTCFLTPPARSKFPGETRGNTKQLPKNFQTCNEPEILPPDIKDCDRKRCANFFSKRKRFEHQKKTHQNKPSFRHPMTWNLPPDLKKSAVSVWGRGRGERWLLLREDEDRGWWQPRMRKDNHGEDRWDEDQRLKNEEGEDRRRSGTRTSDHEGLR